MKNQRHLLGSTLIFFSFLILFFTYYPFIRLYFFSYTTPIRDYNYSITIPKINAYAPIIPNINPREKDEYLKALSQGVAETAGNPWFLFAHSSDLPWKLTRYNTAFLRLGNLQKGDRIIINKNNTRYVYKVVEKKEVWPDQVQYLKEADEKKLILMTCTPVGTSLKRLLVFAQPL